MYWRREYAGLQLTQLSHHARHISLQSFCSNAYNQQYDVTADDQRFVMVRNLPRAEGEVIVVENFFEELKSRVGN